MAVKRRNPREVESRVVVMLDGRQVGVFGPYQTARAALADAKTLAISRRDNDAANAGIDAVVHTYRDRAGNEIGYSVEARKRDEMLPQAFEVLLDSAGTPAARSGSTYARKAQKAVSVAFNPQITFKAKGKRVSFFAKKNPDALDVGSYVDVEKGSTKIGIPAHSTLRIMEITPLGADYGHNVRVVVSTANGRGPARKALYARHMNRLSDVFVTLGDGTGINKISVKRHTGYYAKKGK